MTDISRAKRHLRATLTRLGYHDVKVFTRTGRDGPTRCFAHLNLDAAPSAPAFEAAGLSVAVETNFITITGAAA